MTNTIYKSGELFSTEVDMMEVTSLHRPDTGWQVRDIAGHVHQWYEGGKPATHYSPSGAYDTPTLKWVQDGTVMYEDADEPTPTGHYECAQCGERIERGYCADTHSQYIAGLRHYTIDGVTVGQAEFNFRFSGGTAAEWFALSRTDTPK